MEDLKTIYAPLAAVIRERASKITDRDQTTDDDRDNAALLNTLAAMICGLPIHRAFGGPGEWGYETRIGETLRKCYSVPGSAKVDLTFSALRSANVQRLPKFKNAKGELSHEKPDGSDWKLSAWCNAVNGEMGEAGEQLIAFLIASASIGRAANTIKKIERGDVTLVESTKELSDEIADAVTYLDILACRAEIDLGSAVRSKFNRISDRVDCDVKL